MVISTSLTLKLLDNTYGVCRLAPTSPLPTWGILKVVGPLDFSLVGILTQLSTLLSKAHISIFAVSTYDTDYLLVKATDLDRAVHLL